MNKVWREISFVAQEPTQPILLGSRIHQGSALTKAAVSCSGQIKSYWNFYLKNPTSPCNDLDHTLLITTSALSRGA